MADTKRGYFTEMICSDCGVKGCSFIHWGEMLPAGTMGCFCFECWIIRLTDFDETRERKPLGVIWRLVPQEFIDKAIMVRTRSGAVYMLGKPLNKTSFLVTPLQKQLALHRPVVKKGESLSFDYAAIMLLRMGKSMLLSYFSEEELRAINKLETVENIWSRAGVYHTTAVVSISCSETKDGVRKEITQSEDFRETMRNLFELG